MTGTASQPSHPAPGERGRITSRYPVDELRSFIETVLGRYDVPPADARITAHRMLEADIRGMAGHGIFRLPAYADRLAAGGYTIDADLRVTHETHSSALVDGGNGLGHVIVTRAAQIAVAKANQTGLAWVGVRRSNHAGAAGVYAAMALDHDLIGLYLAVGSANHLPPWGGVEPLLSTNPLAVAIPAGAEPPVVVDMATTVVSYGRIKVAAERGERIPEGWLVDAQGEPITDPTRSAEGFLVPIGEHKGSGLSMIIGMLAGVLNGAAFGRDVVDFTRDQHTPANTGQTIVMIRPDLFRPLDDFQAEMDHHVRQIRESAPLPGHSHVRVPGDQIPARRARAHERGIELAGQTAERLARLADELDLARHPFR
ncbi:Ldh family oxidoreductase [Actinobacteria bacterium YIM 96077]|uniref:Ldh family oxidoreductase n=1 Tax=Phytoactinopolyspora halophila TaxID=1981511 RepID=A0A329QNP3_9ACTN|nr:Ldh family oxidoreductase [Phytoactinopolyspora halophila]AYY12296.1 Ldh family oxidoreductase [Actinobacteria bacterium YIM 96077]RAW13786.1 Ldh family oxidoreductase [Phytoactinopolyspora halophila]